jgi:hypothetical protein
MVPGREPFDGAVQPVFARTFEGWKESGRSYLDSIRNTSTSPEATGGPRSGLFAASTATAISNTS